jgi:hypothetical protein
MIQAEARVCRFCKTNFDAPARGGAPPPTPPKKSNTTMIIVIVAAVVRGGPCIVGVRAALLFPAIAKATKNAKVTSCAANLRQLWTMQNNYMVQFGGTQKRMSSETGRDFWLRLSKPPSTLIDASLKDIYRCPVKGGYSECDYRGPSSDVNLYGDGDPVGADMSENHGSSEGGNVLLKSGDLQTVESRDRHWTLAERMTCP